MDVIASLRLQGLRDGSAFPVEIEVCRPICDNVGATEGYEEWQCQATIRPLYSSLAPASGADSFHSLIMAIDLVRLLLRDFVDKGGQLFLEGGGQFPLEEAYGFFSPRKKA